MKKNLREFSRRVSYLIPHIMREVFKKEVKEVSMEEVTFPQMVVLELLKEKKNCIMKDIAENFSITTSAATGLVDRMVKLHFLKRAYDPKDRRVISIKMTRKGEKIIDRIRQKKLNLMTKIFGKLSQRERNAYLGILEKIYSVLKKEKR